MKYRILQKGQTFKVQLRKFLMWFDWEEWHFDDFAGYNVTKSFGTIEEAQVNVNEEFGRRAQQITYWHIL